MLVDTDRHVVIVQSEQTFIYEFIANVCLGAIELAQVSSLSGFGNV